MKKQTHIRIFKSDQPELVLFMNKYKIKSQARAFNILLRKRRTKI